MSAACAEQARCWWRSAGAASACVSGRGLSFGGQLTRLNCAVCAVCPADGRRGLGRRFGPGHQRERGRRDRRGQAAGQQRLRAPGGNGGRPEPPGHRQGGLFHRGESRARRSAGNSAVKNWQLKSWLAAFAGALWAETPISRDPHPHMWWACTHAPKGGAALKRARRRKTAESAGPLPALGQAQRRRFRRMPPPGPGHGRPGHRPGRFGRGPSQPSRGQRRFGFGPGRFRRRPSGVGLGPRAAGCANRTGRWDSGLDGSNREDRLGGGRRGCRPGGRREPRPGRGKPRPGCFQDPVAVRAMGLVADGDQAVRDVLRGAA